jgi:diguanylate cyclase (GGDEF)-like protein
VSARRLVWRWWAGATALATTGYFALPRDTGAQRLSFAAFGLICAVGIILGVRLNRPRRPGAWYCFATALFTTTIGNSIVAWYQQQDGRIPYPSAADLFFTLSYPMIALGMLSLLRVRQGRNVAGLLDAAMATTAIGLAFWVFVLHPVAAGSGASIGQRILGTEYPCWDILLVALLARLYLGGSGRITTSDRILGVSAALLMAGDVTFALVSLQEPAYGACTNIWLPAYALFALAALHPSMSDTAGAARQRDHTHVRPIRLALLAAGSLSAPFLLFVPGIWADPLDRVCVALGAAFLVGLVATRLAGVVTETQRQSTALERLAMRDDLTGLANRRRFDKALGAALGSGQAQVALLGLNNFKTINDELGHQVGDRLLGELAGRLVAATGSGALVARMSGDEFAILLPWAGPAEADALAERLAGSLRAPIFAGGHELLVGAGIGLADDLTALDLGGPTAGAGFGGPGRGPGSSSGGGPGSSPGSGSPERRAAEVLRRAGVAMFAAKQTGEPCKRWTPALDERSAEHARLGAEMRAALDRGQFRVVYQPIVLLPEGRIRAVEALVRWEHPERGLVSPVQFVPVAEQNGLIVELGAWILHTACARLVAWRAELGDGAPEKVSVNVSARQLARPDFAATVAGTLAATGLPAECLTVEVTETAVFEGGQAVTTLHELRALGVRIALDDFGTGHSSLGLLQTVPVDTLKVDKSFVDRITEAGRHAVIAEALIQVSTGLGLTAVAEGVETAEQAAALYRLGYRLLQGYHYGRPVADPDFDLVRATVAAGGINSGAAGSINGGAAGSINSSAAGSINSSAAGGINSGAASGIRGNERAVTPPAG